MPTIDNRQDPCRFIRVNHLLWDQAELLGEFMSHQLPHLLSRLVSRQHKRLVDMYLSLGSPFPGLSKQPADGQLREVQIASDARERVAERMGRDVVEQATRIRG